MKKVMFFNVLVLLVSGMLCCSGSVTAQGGNPLLLLRYPSMSQTQIVFEYGGEIWEVARNGGQAHVLATGMDLLTKPIFSPDGSEVAFSGTFDHNTDVYVVPATGGQPERLTWHPDPDIAIGWTPDGKDVLFRSHRYSYADPNQLYTVPVTGGFPGELPLSMAESGCYSPDGSQISYVPNFQWEPFWKGYKGGQHTQIWIARLSDSHTIRIPNLNSNENDPMWVGNTIYFLSDRDGPITLFSYDVNTEKVSKLINNTGFDITSASAGPGGIVYSQFGQLHIYDFATGQAHLVPVIVNGDLPQRRPYYQDVSKQLMNPGISPNGIRAVFQAHGDILTVPIKHGSVFNLTHSPGVMDRDPAWSPDGKSIAYFSDRDGEYDLYIRQEEGGTARKISLGQDDAFYYNLTWSPDNEKVVFNDQKDNLWYVNIKTTHPTPVRITTSDFYGRFNASWSPDSRWIAYNISQSNFLSAIFIYSLSDGKSYQVTDGSSDCENPVFDANGKYLYFTSSTFNYGPWPTHGVPDLFALAHPMMYHVYTVTLQDSSASPIPPRSGFEVSSPSNVDSSTIKEVKEEKHPKKKIPLVSIDFKGISERIVSLPIKPGNYQGLVAGPSGVLFLLKAPMVILPDAGPMELERFDLKTRKTAPLKEGLTAFILSANRKMMLYQEGANWFISDTAAAAKPMQLDIKDIRVFVKPQEQWKQMYHEAWRIERAFFYNPTFDGLDINAAEKEFAHYLPGIASRDGLSYLFEEMLSYMSVGHMFIRGGYVPKMDEIKVGLLGANYKIEHEHYRITRIFTAGKWNPELYAPLAQPGLKVKEGDYLLAVNGQPITGTQSIYAAFEDLAGETVTLRVGPNPDTTGSHIITVKTIPSEAMLRKTAWIDHNMEMVNKLSDGKLAYIYLPNTSWKGFTNFNRYFFSQIDKQGAIIDERFNHGGFLSDYFIRHLTRKPMGLLVVRWGKRTTALTPADIIPGPKVMLINQYAGSGGDALPWYFKIAKAGTLVGVRTWGGLVGIGGYPQLMDGGTVTAPRIAVEGLDGTFPVENHGIAPDVEVWQDPELVRQGQDPQLEAAVKVALQQLKANPPKQYQRPPWRNYHPTLPPLPEPAKGGE